MFTALFRNAPRDSRRARFARWWTRYVGSIAFLTLILGLSLGFARVENARFESCEGGNILREGLRQAEAQNVAQIEALKRRPLFKGYTPEQFAVLKRESIARAVEHITVNYASRPCGTHIQFPLTGAVVRLPLGG